LYLVIWLKGPDGKNYKIEIETLCFLQVEIIKKESKESVIKGFVFFKENTIIEVIEVKCSKGETEKKINCAGMNFLRISFINPEWVPRGITPDQKSFLYDYNKGKWFPEVVTK